MQTPIICHIPVGGGQVSPLTAQQREGLSEAAAVWVPQTHHTPLCSHSPPVKDFRRLRVIDAIERS